GADATVREVRHMLSLGEKRQPGDWRPPVVKMVAARQEGIDELLEALDKHRAWLEETGTLQQRRERRAGAEIEAISVASLRARMGDLRGGDLLPQLAADVAAGRTDPYSASDRLLGSLGETL
ncbi:MAG: hypothetical protein ACTHNT_12850, partial [Actinomycetales bacterium]